MFDEEPGIGSSPLSLPGAVERCVELFSFAKSYQLGGCRLGFALGNADVLASLEAVKVCWCACVCVCGGGGGRCTAQHGIAQRDKM